jgi:hypothetical protein
MQALEPRPTPTEHGRGVDEWHKLGDLERLAAAVLGLAIQPQPREAHLVSPGHGSLLMGLGQMDEVEGELACGVTNDRAATLYSAGPRTQTMMPKLSDVPSARLSMWRTLDDPFSRDHGQSARAR